MSDDLRRAIGNLSARERQALGAQCQDAGMKYAASLPALATVWQALGDVVLDVDRLQRARLAAQMSMHDDPPMRTAHRRGEREGRGRGAG